MTQRIGILIVVASMLAGCGASLHSSDARKELRDCRRIGDNSACVAVAARHVDGDEADIDLDRARRLYTRACVDDPSNYCHHLGLFGLGHEDSGVDIDRVTEVLERGCRRYDVGACAALVDVLEADDSGAYDPDYAQRIRDRLCLDGFDWFCFKDTDGDGINDEDDDCDEVVEDFDGFEDEDGCPDFDNDQDGLVDHEDACPNDAEDADGFEDEDGCVDPDNDQDGVLDVDDGCPDAAEDMDEFADEDGCPELDNDLDGILDDADECPVEAEDVDGFEDSDGCPEEGEGLVQLTCDAIVIADKVYFGPGSDVIEARSYELLDQVGAVLRTVSYINLVEIAGHTDDRGDEDGNLELSDRRAAAVRAYLEAAGVDGARLRSVGYGETSPIADNGSSAGRAENRRVEFNIVEQDTVNCGQ